MYKEYQEIVAMKCRLETVYSNGVELYLDGEPITPTGIMEHFVKEDSVYMPDFVINEEGVLTQIRYDKVDEK